MSPEESVRSVAKALRRVTFQGSLFGQTVAIRLGLSESDVEALELLIEAGGTTAGRLAELLGLTTGAVTRVIDRLEQAGYVRRYPDPADRRRVIVEVVPHRTETVESLLERLDSAADAEAGRYTDAQLATIEDFLGRMAELTAQETERLRTATEAAGVGGPAEHAAPIAGLTSARLAFRAGVSELRLRGSRVIGDDLYRASFEGATPTVRVRSGTVSVQYRSLGFDWRRRTAALSLNDSVPWSVEVLGGVRQLEAELVGIDLQGFEVTGGAERIDLRVGSPTGEVPIRVVGGARTIRVERPAGVAARLSVMGGAKSVEFDERSAVKGTPQAFFEDAAWSSATDRYTVEVVGGVERVSVGH
jgi:DNA-binding MarR family transcriptional regulator